MSVTRSAAVRRKLTIVWAVALVASIAAGPVIANGSAFGNEGATTTETESPTPEAEAASGGDSTGTTDTTVVATSDGATASGTPATETAPTISDGYAFTFTFLHTDGTTSVLSGTSESNVGFLPSAGGSTVPGTGMDVHVSCSDDYPNGWGDKDGPVEGVDTEWRVQSYLIEKYKDGAVDKSCGDTLTLLAETATTDWSSEDWSEYTFEFADGTIISGSNRSDGDGYTGDKNEADLGLSENVHVSCSDDFNLDRTDPTENGWGDKGAPVFGIDPSPVISYSIDKYNGGEYDKSCSDSSVLIPLPGSDPLPAMSIDLEKLVKVEGGAFVDADTAPGPDAVYGSDVFFRF
ncbi:MAG: hypothetical protein HKN93_08185, partial [Acidimicrobiia bacterium]|nr:hypothetical protein [Acidimicrobiia bacterium]